VWEKRGEKGRERRGEESIPGRRAAKTAAKAAAATGQARVAYHRECVSRNVCVCAEYNVYVSLARPRPEMTPAYICAMDMAG